MPHFAWVLLALCLVARTSADSQNEDEELPENYREVREALSEIFAHGVDPTQQKGVDASPPSLRGTVTGMGAYFFGVPF